MQNNIVANQTSRLREVKHPLKAGRKTRSSLAHSNWLISGLARLGSLKNINEPSQGFSSVSR